MQRNFDMLQEFLVGFRTIFFNFYRFLPSSCRLLMKMLNDIVRFIGGAISTLRDNFGVASFLRGHINRLNRHNFILISHLLKIHGVIEYFACLTFVLVVRANTSNKWRSFKGFGRANRVSLDRLARCNVVFELILKNRWSSTEFTMYCSTFSVDRWVWAQVLSLNLAVLLEFVFVYRLLLDFLGIYYLIHIFASLFEFLSLLFANFILT